MTYSVAFRLYFFRGYAELFLLSSESHPTVYSTLASVQVAMGRTSVISLRSQSSCVSKQKLHGNFV